MSLRPTGVEGWRGKIVPAWLLGGFAALVGWGVGFVLVELAEMEATAIAVV